MCSEWSAWKVRMGRLKAMDLILRSDCFCSGRSNGSIVSGSSGWCWEWADVSSRLNTARGAGRSGPPQWVAHSSTSKALCPLVGLMWYSSDSLVLCKCFHLCHDGEHMSKYMWEICYPNKINTHTLKIKAIFAMNLGGAVGWGFELSDDCCNLSVVET